MGAMGYDVGEVRGGGSGEFERLGRCEMGLVKDGVLYVRDGGGRDGGGGRDSLGGRRDSFGGREEPSGVGGEKASAYVAGHGRGGSRSGGYTAGGGSAPHVGPLGTAIRDSGESVR